MKENTNSSSRIKVSMAQCNESILQCQKMLEYRLNEKGSGTLSSRHEIQGVLTEEYHEAIDALHHNDVEEFKKELLDIAVSCIFGIACIDAGTIEW